MPLLLFVFVSWLHVQLIKLAVPIYRYLIFSDIVLLMCHHLVFLESWVVEVV